MVLIAYASSGNTFGAMTARTLNDRPPEPDRLLSIRAVSELTSLSEPTIRRYVRAGTFPRSTKIGPNRSAWSLQQVTRWIEEKKGAAP